MTKRTRGPSSCAGCGSTNGTSRRRSRSTDCPGSGAISSRCGTATPYVRIERPQPRVELEDLLAALTGVLARAQTYRHHQVRMESLSVRERMSIVLEHVQRAHFVEFTALFTPQEGRQGVVVTLLALLELLRESLIDLVQARPFGPVYVRAAGEKGVGE